MGARHQAFLIARISGRYRCVAGFHDQGCSGRYPLKATCRFLTLMEQPLNGAIILEELQRIARAKDVDESFPSRYLANLLACSFSVGLEEEETYAAGPIELDYGFLKATMGCWDGDNNDGLTIIDITNPQHGSYCFLLNTAEQDEDEDWPQRRIPDRSVVDAETYCRYYHPRRTYYDEDEYKMYHADVGNAICSLAGDPVISIETLAEVWPREFRSQLSSARREHSQEPTQAYNSIERTRPSKDSAVIPSLSDLLLLPAVQHALATNGLDGIEHLLEIPGKAEAVISLLRSPEFTQFPDSALPLLLQDIDKLKNSGPELDLSRFPLSEAQIISLIKQRKGIYTLDLSHNPNVTISTVSSVLSTVPGLKRLVLFEAPITEEDWSDLLAKDPTLFYNLESLVHHCFYNAQRPFYPNAFFVLFRSWSVYGIRRPTTSLPFFTPTLVVDALIQLFSSREYLEADENRWSALYSSATPTVAFSHQILPKGQGFGGRHIPFFAPTTGLIKKQGWGFYYSDDSAPTGSAIGFLKFCHPEASHNGSENEGGEGTSVKTFDLDGFLAEMEKEGRPRVPEEKVQALSAAFERLTTAQPPRNRWEKPIDPTQWLTDERAGNIEWDGKLRHKYSDILSSH